MMKGKVIIFVMLLVSFTVKAQEPNWVEVVEGDSIFIDINSIGIEPEQKNWVNFDMVLNLPLPITHDEYKKLVAYYGAEPIAFFNNSTINCLEQTIRRNTDGIAYGSFKSMRKNAEGIPYTDFKEGELLEFKKETNSEFEKLDSSESDSNKILQLVCHGLPHSKSNHVNVVESNATLSQIFPKLKSKPDLIELNEKEVTLFLDKNSLEVEDNQKKIIKFTVVYDLPKENQKQDNGLIPYFVNTSINCTDKTIKTNYKGFVTDYSKDALLLEYHKQRKPNFEPLGELNNLFQSVCGN